MPAVGELEVEVGIPYDFGCDDQRGRNSKSSEAGSVSAFSLHMSDGRTFTVRHPEQIFVLRHKVVIGLPETAEIPERTENLSMLHITSVEEAAA